MPASWRLSARAGERSLARPVVMAILNVTPDSFSDGGMLSTPGRVAAAARVAVRDGADVLDIGGESTRPGAARVEPDAQIRRVVPAIIAVREAGLETPISVDTTRAAVAEAALDAGADAINDVSGGTEDPEMLGLAAARGAGVVLMHRLVPPDLDSYSDRYVAPPAYGDVVADVAAALRGLARRAIDAGIRPHAIVLDPGLGFGKTVEQNLELVRGTRELTELGFPLLGGASRKSFTARAAAAFDPILSTDAVVPAPEERAAASVAFSLAQLAGGARVFRVHDVRLQTEALRAWWRIHDPTGRDDRE